jgi:hypothetical protein
MFCPSLEVFFIRQTKFVKKMNPWIFSLFVPYCGYVKKIYKKFDWKNSRLMRGFKGECLRNLKGKTYEGEGGGNLRILYRNPCLWFPSLSQIFPPPPPQYGLENIGSRETVNHRRTRDSLERTLDEKVSDLQPFYVVPDSPFQTETDPDPDIKKYTKMSSNIFGLLIWSHIYIL